MKKKEPITNSLPYDNFGSFFGPSQPVIAQRVIQERLAETALKAKNAQNMGGSSTQTISKPRPNGQQPRRVDNYATPQAKIQMIKNTRDYSFLADGAELSPNPPKNPRPRPDGHSSQRQQPTNIGRKVVRPSGQKPLPSKMSTVPTSRNISMGHKPLPSIPTPAALEQKRKPVMPSRPQIKQQPARPPPSSAQQRERVQKRPARPFADEDDDVNAISMIRNMFGYNPNKYRGVNDDDLSDMEAGFDDIMMEEKRSSKIAAMEDEEERIKIEEEERRECMRKEAKKRKLSQRKISLEK